MMQQTEKYQFNLIEPSDTFSPDPLNENMEKVEAQFDAVRAEAADLDQRLKVFESKHYVIGYYTGSKDPDQEIYLGFTPKVIGVTSIENGSGNAMSFLPREVKIDTNYNRLQIIEGGFRAGMGSNYTGRLFCYLAID